jgi:hypothetical protein
MGGTDVSGFVCTWCALVCASRVALDAHWEKDRACRSNRNASNQTASKYGDLTNPNQFSERQGEAVLQLVERIEAEHAAGIAHIPSFVR